MTPNRKKDRTPGSRLLALVFMIIAIMGIMMVYTSPAGTKSSPQLTEQQEGSLVPDSTDPAAVNLVGYLWKVVLVTALVIGLFWLMASWYRQKMMPSGGSSTLFRVLGREQLNPRNSLVMVRVEDRKYLLGVSENAVNLISEFQLSEDEMQEESESGSGSPSFSGILQQVKDRISGNGGSA